MKWRGKVIPYRRYLPKIVTVVHHEDLFNALGQQVLSNLTVIGCSLLSINFILMDGTGDQPQMTAAYLDIGHCIKLGCCDIQKMKFPITEK